MSSGIAHHVLRAGRTRQAAAADGAEIQGRNRFFAPDASEREEDDL
jgi:hypothetical protein